MKRVLVVLPLVILAGCASRGPTSVASGECKAFERPEYAVRGARQYDQDWIDSTVEGGVGACGWKRPEPRPASLDAAPAVVATKETRAAPAKPKPKAWVRILNALRHRRPAVSEPAAVDAAQPEPPALPPPPKEQRPIDALLGGDKNQ